MQEGILMDFEYFTIAETEKEAKEKCKAQKRPMHEISNIIIHSTEYNTTTELWRLTGTMQIVKTKAVKK
jgi:hypothetical protein